MSIEIQTGTPTIEGRYVVFSSCEAGQIRDWCEPHIATWSGGKWIFFRPIFGWIGPLPVMSQNDFLKLREKGQEYDL